MRYWILALAMLAILMMACGEDKADDTTTVDESDGGVDQMTGVDAGVDAGSETIVEQNPAEQDPEVQSGQTGGTQADSDEATPEEEAELITASKDFELIEANDYLVAFVNRKTAFVFDQQRSKGPIVAAAIELQSYYNNADYYDVMPINSAGKHIGAYLDKNLILLGNGCTNDLIRDVLDDENCRAGLNVGEAMVRLGKVDGMRVLLIIGYSDADAYELVKQLVAEKVSWSGSEKIVKVN